MRGLFISLLYALEFLIPNIVSVKPCPPNPTDLAAGGILGFIGSAPF
jgi:hypothetical protein